MKKIMLCLFLLMLLVTGCDSKKQEEIKEADFDLYNGYFKTAEPYKAAISENYMLTNMDNRYDINEVEKGLMRITSKYLDNNKYFY